MGGQVAVGDVTGDGIPDIVNVSNNYHSISTLPGIGNGSFGAAVTTPVNLLTQFVVSLVLIDLNGDGRMDLVVSGYSSNDLDGGINVLFSNGDGTFQTPVSYEVQDSSLGDPVVGDFNGDGIPDVIAPGPKGIWLFTGKGGGTFNAGVLTPINPSGAYSAAAADFNGDGKLDVAVSVAPTGLSVLFGNGDGSFQAPLVIDPKSAGQVVAAPLTRGGLPSIVVPESFHIYVNNGKGAFLGPLATPVAGNEIAVGDLNGDGIPDLADNDGCVALGTGGVKFATPVCYATASTGTRYNVALGEFVKGSSKPDIVVGLRGLVSVLLNRGDGAFIDGAWTSVPLVHTPSFSPASVATADFNGDGKPDLAVPGNAGIQILLGTGNASVPYSMGETLTFPGAYPSELAGDVNGDGIPDLLVADGSIDGGVYIYLGRGDGKFLLTSAIPFGPASKIVTGDFNHDGKLDVATAGNQFALGNGDGTFQAPLTILANPPAQGLSWIAAGDVNNDGWPDLVATSNSRPPATLGLLVLLNDRKGGFTLSDTISGPSYGVSLADLNGDGNLDAVTYDGSAQVYLGNGRGGFTPGQQISDPSSVFVTSFGGPAIGDVDGDGIPDLLIADNGNLAIALGTGKGTFYAPFLLGLGPNPSLIVLENLHGQSDSAGLPDIVAPNWSPGGVMVLINLTK